MIMEVYVQRKKRIAKWVFCVLFALIFATATILVLTGVINAADTRLLLLVRGIRDSFVTLIAKGITFCANTTTIAGFCAVLLILPARARIGIPVSIASGIAALCQYGLKELIERVRPDEVAWLVDATGFSFPSGHSNTGLVCYIFFMILLRRYLILHEYHGVAWLVSALIPLLVILIGVSRVYLGVHYPSDIIGGWSLGGFLLIIFMAIYGRYYPLRYRLAYERPTWDMMRRRRPWKRPATTGKESGLIEFPKYRSPWKRVNTTEQRRQAERERAEQRKAKEKQD
jgi:undecaprenyl-diphosphatase